jgi:hypothetical protein
VDEHVFEDGGRPAAAAPGRDIAAGAGAVGRDGDGAALGAGTPGFDVTAFCDALRTLTLDALTALADEHAALVRAAEARHLLVLGVLAERAVHRVDGTVDLAGWIAQRDAVRPATARAAAAVATRLEALPAIAVVAASGALSVDQLAPLVRIATPATDAEWAARAPGWSPASLELAARRTERIDATSARAAFARREVRFWTDRRTGDGRFSGQLPADRMAMFRSAVEQHAHETRAADARPSDQPAPRWETRCADALVDLVLDGARPGARGSATPMVVAHVDARLLHGRARAGPLRRAADGRGRAGSRRRGPGGARARRPGDASGRGPGVAAAGPPPPSHADVAVRHAVTARVRGLVEAMADVSADGRRAADAHLPWPDDPWRAVEPDCGCPDAHDPSAGPGADAELEPDAVWAQLDDGTPISVETARRLACDAVIQTWLVDRFTPFALGRSRRDPTPAQQAALRLRSPTCEWPGCAARRGLSAHHLRWWIRRGRTDLENLVLLCYVHHHQVHEGGSALHGDPTRPGGLRVTRPDGRPLPAKPAPWAGPVRPERRP